ncbi:hypothetical protein CspHIS471_0606170 [Cutaneotrichosporon sp. HIS471]|nr:hypothetical protein CspHIS471_0606170 [Cutaneotrichosporon sp. HIS471]
MTKTKSKFKFPPGPLGPRRRPPRDPQLEAMRRSARLTVLRNLLSDPEDPLRAEHAAEVSRIKALECRLVRNAGPRSSERAACRLRNIEALRRLADDTNNPRRAKHAEELQRSEAAQARYEKYGTGRGVIAQPMHHVYSAYNTGLAPDIPISLGGGGVVHAQHVPGTSMWHTSGPVQVNSGVGPSDVWVNVTIVGNPAAGPPAIPSGGLVRTQPPNLTYPNGGYPRQPEFEPHDLQMASPSRSPLPNTPHMYAPVLGRTVAPLPCSDSGQTMRHSRQSPAEDPVRSNTSEAGASAILANDAGPCEMWIGKRKRSNSPSFDDTYQYDDIANKKYRAGDMDRPSRPFKPASRREPVWRHQRPCHL